MESMHSEFNEVYYAVSKRGFILINDNAYDYSQDKAVINLITEKKRLVLGDHFDQDINFLPNEITVLQLGMKFNRPIMNLPRGLKHLYICPCGFSYSNFNQSLDYLPIGLESLSIRLNRLFNMPIDNLPASLKDLEILCSEYKQPINNLPEGLEKLWIGTFDYKNTYSLPSTLKHFNIDRQINNDILDVIKENLISKYPSIKFMINNICYNS